jgi:hypothetical protein
LVSSSDTVWFTATDINGCVVSDTIEALIVGDPSVDLGANPVGVCDNVGVTLDAGVQTGYLWSTGDTTQTIQAFQQGTYSVTVFNQYGCQDDDAVTVSVVQAPRPDLGPDSTYCEGQYPLTLDPGSNNGNFSWSDGSDSTELVVSQPGTYWVQVVDGNGCIGTDTVTVSIRTCVGIAETGSSIDISVYPNPTREFVWVDLKSGVINRDNITIKLMDLSGQTIEVTDEWNPEENGRFKLDMTSLSVGTYFVVIETDQSREIVPIQKY